MAIQSYGGSGLFGQPSFGDYSGLSGGVPVPMTPEEIQYQLLKQDVPDYQNVMDMYFGTPNTSSFNANVNSRPTGRELSMNSYLDPNFLPPVSRMDYTQGTAVEPVEAINQISVTNKSNSDLPPAPNGKMWEFDANSNQYVLVDDPLFNLSQDASQTAPVASAQQVARPAPPASASASASSSVVAGMFPEVEAMQRALYQQKQNEAMQAQAMQFARLSPMQQAQYSLYMGGQQLGGAIGGALGAKDPQMQMIGLQSRILSELVPGNPAQNIQIAQKYARFAPELAMKINNDALDQLVKMKQASSASKLNVTAKVQEADAYASTFGPEGSPEYKNAYQTYLQDTDKLSDAQVKSNAVSGLKANLRVLETQPQPSQEAIQRIKDQIQSLEPDKQNVAKIGVAKASGKVVYFDKDTDEQFIKERNPKDPTKQIRVLFEGDVDQTTSNVSATASTKQAEGINKGKIDMATSIEENAFSASDRITLAQNLRELAPKAFTGFAADAKLSASKLASAFGIPTKGGSESEIIDQILGQMTIGAAGQLKGALSDKDVLFLKKTIGTRGLSVNTLLFVADEIERMAAQDRHLNKRINEVTRTGGNLNEINFEEEKSKSSSYVKQQMSDYRDILKKVQNNTATLEEAIKARQIRDQLGL